MDESSPPTLPTSKSPERPVPTLKIPFTNIASDLRKTLFSPTACIGTPTFRPNYRSLSFICLFTLAFFLCSLLFLFSNPHIHRSFKSVLARRPRVPFHFPDFIFGDAIPPENGREGMGDLGLGNIKGLGNESSLGNSKEKGRLETMANCDVFDGEWVKSDLAPLYEGGSCPFMEESFNCYRNGRPDKDYERYRWQPHHSDIPRLNPWKLLRLLRGKRMVYVGDSLNRNMWESMVCLLWNSVRDKSRVFEASGRNEFKKEGAYSFIFLDYNCSVEYIRSAFLVQEWEVPLKNGSTKETLRIDMVEQWYDTLKDADVLIFNTGNWWTHEKTSQGRGYYQEGDHVHEKLDVEEAFAKAMETWARWIETNIDPEKTHVFFRGYSFSHFSKGEWNTGGRCDDKDPIVDKKDLLNIEEVSPSIPQMLNKSMERVRIPVYYQDVTRMTNYRRDAHPSLYRQPNMTEDVKQNFETHQDCSHWCLPGVPDTWNELLYAQLLFIYKQVRWKQQNHKK